MSEYLQQAIANAAVTASYISLVGVSFCVFYQINRFFHIAHGANLVVGAYAGYAVSASLSVPFLWAVGAGATASAACGLLGEIAVFRPLRRRRGGEMELLVASLGLFIVLEAAVSLVFGSDTKVMADRWSWSISIHEARLSAAQVITIVFNLLTTLSVVAYLRASQFGLRFRAAATSPDLAQTVGVDVDGLCLRVAWLAAGICGSAGVLWSADLDLTPTMGFHAILLGVIAVVAGGGRIAGTFVAAHVLAAVQHATALYCGARWQDVSVFAILITVFIVRPQGIFSKRPQRDAS